MLVKHVERPSITKAHFIQVTKNLGCGEYFSIINTRKRFHLSGLIINTRHWTMSGKKSDYVPQQLLLNRHSCPAAS